MKIRIVNAVGDKVLVDAHEANIDPLPGDLIIIEGKHFTVTPLPGCFEHFASEHGGSWIRTVFVKPEGTEGTAPVTSTSALTATPAARARRRQQTAPLA